MNSSALAVFTYPSPLYPQAHLPSSSTAAAWDSHYIHTWLAKILR